jgi:hypothetical protein
MLIGEGKCGANLFQARGALVFSQKLINFECLWERQAARIYVQGRDPGEERSPGLLVGHEAVRRKMSPGAHLRPDR